MSELLAARHHTWNNKAEIESSNLCGCCTCQQIFPPEEIVAWASGDVGNLEDLESLGGGTALCPRCGGDAVIGDKSGFSISPNFLARMNEAWFQKTIIGRPKPNN